MTADSETLTREETLEVVLELLNAAATAHGVHEATVLEGRHDDEWPEWYTEHMVTALTAGGYRLVRSTEGAA